MFHSAAVKIAFFDVLKLNTGLFFLFFCFFLLRQNILSDLHVLVKGVDVKVNVIRLTYFQSNVVLAHTLIWFQAGPLEALF